MITSGPQSGFHSVTTAKFIQVTASHPLPFSPSPYCDPSQREITGSRWAKEKRTRRRSTDSFPWRLMKQASAWEGWALIAGLGFWLLPDKLLCIISKIKQFYSYKWLRAALDLLYGQEVSPTEQNLKWWKEMKIMFGSHSEGHACTTYGYISIEQERLP